MQVVLIACWRTRAIVGRRIATSTAIIPITTNSSTNVKPCERDDGEPFVRNMATPASKAPGTCAAIQESFAASAGGDGMNADDARLRSPMPAGLTSPEREVHSTSALCAVNYNSQETP